VTAVERQYENERQENMRDQRIRIAMARRCSGTCVFSAPHDGPHMRQDGTRFTDGDTSDGRIIQAARRTPTWTPNLANVRNVAETFLDELSASGIDPSGRSAHWWVGCLSSQLEYFLAATDPERAK
jgi:hypothetical protein